MGKMLISKKQEQRNRNTLFASLAAAVLAGAAQVMPVLCLNTNINPDSIITSVVSVITTIAVYVGVVLLFWGIFQLILSFKNDDAEAKSRATTLLVTTICLIGIKVIAGPVMTAIGLTV